MRILNLYIFLTIFFVSFSCSTNRQILTEIKEEDSTIIDYPFVDLKSLLVKVSDSTLTFNVQLRGTSDSIDCSGENFYSFDIWSSINDSVRLEITCLDKRDVKKDKKIMPFKKHLLENKDILFGKCILHKNGSKNCYEIDSLIVTVKNNVISLCVGRGNITDTMLQALKNNTVVRTTYYKPSPTCDNTFIVDFLQKGIQTFKDTERGIDTNNCH